MRKEDDKKKFDLLYADRDRLETSIVDLESHYSIDEIIRRNCFNYLAVDDIASCLESYTKKVTFKTFEKMIDNHLLDEIYNRYQKKDGYGWDLLQDVVLEVWTEKLNEVKRNKNKRK